jgi:hypothetical protein
MIVYIPSFFNDSEERSMLFKRCVNSYLKQGYEVVILWMNDDKYKLFSSKITYIDSKVVLNASEARNILLDKFYDSGAEKAILSDDDVIITNKLEHDFDFDVLSLTNDFSEELKETHEISSSLLIIKKLSERLYFDESLNANQDLDFGINLTRNGFKTYRLKDTSVVLNRGKSVMFNNPMHKLYLKKATLEKIKIKWQIKR